MTATDTHRAIDAVWRIESARLIAGLARIVRDVGLAEELAQDALVAALEQWPESGIPDNPGAWLMATAKHRAIDHFRRNKRLERKHEELGRELQAQQELAVPDFDAALDDDVGDDLLRLVFISCHPVLSTEGARCAHAALAGRPDDRRDRARVPRSGADGRPAHRSGQANPRRSAVPFEVPRGAELAARLSSVLEVIYLIFNEGYSATAGDDWMRPALCEEALRLGRILAELAPQEPEVHGLVALMEIQASRSRARVSSVGRAHPAARSKPRAMGPAPDPSRSRCARACRKARRKAMVRMHCRLRLLRVTRGALRRRKRTGRASWRFTKRSRS